MTERKRQTTSRNDVGAAMRLLVAGGFWCPEITDEMVNVWTRTLRYFPPIVLRETAIHWAAHNDRFPTLNQFRTHANSIGSRMENADTPAVTEGDMRVTPRSEYPERLRELRKLIAVQEGPLFKGVKADVV